MANKQVTLKRVIDTSGNTDTIHPTTHWDQIEGKPSTFTPTSHNHEEIGDGNAKFYAWRAINNTSSSGVVYYKIAHISSQASSRFKIELVGRHAGYGDGDLPNYCVILGQYNNDNNYDVWWFNNETGTSQAVSEVGIVDDGTNGVNIWVKVSNFSELGATAVISDGTITTYDSNSETSSAPTGYTATTEYKLWNSGNDGAGSGLNADQLDNLHASSFLQKTGGTMSGSIAFTNATDIGIQNSSGNSWYRPEDQYGNTHIEVRSGKGIYVDADTIAFRSQANTDRMRINSSGNVGIGTTSPTQKLEVNGNINGNELHLNDTNTIVKEGGGNSIRMQTNSGYIDIGPHNTGWGHIQTDRGRFYFNKGADFDGDVRMYSNNTTKIEESTGHIFELGNRVATQSYVTTQIDNLVDSAPGALDTLNELAAALGDDASFSTTMTNSLAGKLNLTGGTLTGTLTTKAIAMQNFNLTGVNMLQFNDPGPNEGIDWSGGNFKIYESPDDLTTNSAGNLQFVTGGVRRMTVGNDGYLYVSNTVQTPQLQMTSNQNKTKLRVWSGGTYGIGMHSNYTFGGLGTTGGEYAMTFQMNDDNDRGFWWGDSAHNEAQGAMALTTAGKLTVADKIRVGYGQLDTTDPSTYAVDASGDILISDSNPVLQLKDTDTSGSAYIDYQGGTSLKVHAGSDPIVFIAGNSEKARLTAGNGNLGIGTTNPANKLDVYGGSIRAVNGGNANVTATRTAGASVDLTAQSARGVVGTSTNHDFRIKTNASDRMTVKTDGKVGIGTTSPTAVLDVNGALNLKGRAFGDSDGTNSYFKSGTSGSIFFETNGGTRGKIDTSGNFGIGTLSPAEKLDVNGKIRANDNFEHLGSGGYYLYTDAVGFRGALYDNGSVTSIYGDGNGSTPVININSDKVGIGDTSPQGKLTVEQAMTNGGSAFSAPHLALNASNTVDSTGFVGMTLATSTADNYGWSYGAQRVSSGVGDLRWRSHSGTSAGNDRMILTNAGNLGVGVSSPSYAVDVSGDVNVTGNFKVNGANLEAGGNTWTEIKTGSTTISSGTTATNVSLGSNTVDDTTVLAIEINSSVVTSYTSQIIIVKLEDSNSSDAGILFNAQAHNSSIKVGSLRVYRTLSMGPTSTSISFSYAFNFTNGSSSETADTMYVGKIWKLGVTGS